MSKPSRGACAAPSFDGIYQVHLKLGATALAALAAACAGAALIRKAARGRPGCAERADGGALDDLRAQEAALQGRLEQLEELEQTLRCASAQQIVALYRRLHCIVMDAFALSEGEKRIALEVMDGQSNQEIARALGISESTVKHTLTAIYRKTGTATRAAFREQMRRIVRTGALG